MGLGGQEIRVLGEVRWLGARSWDALIACQPGSRLLAEARAAGRRALAYGRSRRKPVITTRTARPDA